MSQIFLVELSDGTRTYVNDRLLQSMEDRGKESGPGKGCCGVKDKWCRTCLKRQTCTKR